MKTSVALLAVLLGVAPVFADEVSEPLDGVTIEDAIVWPAMKGETTRLEFRIDNAGPISLALIGISAPTGGEAELMLRGIDGLARDAPQLSILAGEELDLRSSHIWVALRDLIEPLVEGDTLAFDLIFREGRAPAFAHVHAR